jgi:hypothetical protein
MTSQTRISGSIWIGSPSSHDAGCGQGWGRVVGHLPVARVSPPCGVTGASAGSRPAAYRHNHDPERTPDRPVRRGTGDAYRGGVPDRGAGLQAQEAGPHRVPGLQHRARRLDACRREVELNRRLAPDVYLGVAEVTGVDGRPCDHLVVMRRMPEDRRLATLLSTGAPLADPVRGLARMLAAFHAGARRDPEITVEGGRDALRARWADGFE